MVKGMRRGAELWIYVKAKEAMENGIIFYRSRNNVILTRGLNGWVPPKFFEKVLYFEKTELIQICGKEREDSLPQLHKCQLFNREEIKALERDLDMGPYLRFEHGINTGKIKERIVSEEDQETGVIRKYVVRERLLPFDKEAASPVFFFSNLI